MDFQNLPLRPQRTTRVRHARHKAAPCAGGGRHGKETPSTQYIVVTVPAPAPDHYIEDQLLSYLCEENLATLNEIEVYA